MNADTACEEPAEMIELEATGPGKSPGEADADSKTPPSEGIELDFDTVFSEHAPFVSRVLHRLTGPGPHIDDLLQETFIIAFRKRGNFDGRSTVRTWLYSIAVRLSMRHFRGLGRFYKFRDRLSHEPRDVAERPDHDLERKKKQELVHSVLEKLPRKQKEVFVLYELEELEGKDISEILDIPEGTVWTRLHHARKRFKILMSKRLEGEGP